MLVLGIAGGSGSGKTTVVNEIVKKLPKNSVSVLAQDSYYRDFITNSEEERRQINFDHPDAIEFSLLIQHLQMLLHKKSVQSPTYSYITCRRQKKTKEIYPAKVIVVEGILIFTNPELRNLMNLKVFVDSDSDERLIRIIQRDVNERGRDLQLSINHYLNFVKPMHNQFIEPSKRFADIIIPIGGHNEKGIDILASRILREK
jgi:uridine kinase